MNDTTSVPAASLPERLVEKLTELLPWSKPPLEGTVAIVHPGRWLAIHIYIPPDSDAEEDAQDAMIECVNKAVKQVWSEWTICRTKRHFYRVSEKTTIGRMVGWHVYTFWLPLPGCSHLDFKKFFPADGKGITFV